MFLRRYQRTKGGKTHTYYALVESVRTEAGPRRHIVAYLGELNADQERRRQRTVVSHNRQGEDRQLRLFPASEAVDRPDDPDIVRVRLSSVHWTNARSFGDVYLGLHLWQLLHLDEIVDRHLPRGKEAVRPADIVAIEVINRLRAPCSEFALAERWYASTGLEDLLGVADGAVTKDRLYRTPDRLLAAHEAIENDLKEQLGALFQLDYDLMPYDLTGTHFEGLAEENELARRGYSRDHRGDCKQIVLALVVTRDGFPLAHRTSAGNMQDIQTVERVVTSIEDRFGKSQRVRVMDRGMIGTATLASLGRSGREYLPATRRGELAQFLAQLGRTGRRRLKANPDVEVKPLQEDRVHYLLARGRPRRQKERAIRRRQRRGLARGLKSLHQQMAAGRLKERDKILERVGRLTGRFPKARPFVTIVVSRGKPVESNWSWDRAKYRAASAGDGTYPLRSNQAGWTAQGFGETYIQLTGAEHAFRVLKSELLLRPVWHRYRGRTRAHGLVCVSAYALWKTLDHLAKRAGLQTALRKPDLRRPRSSPKPRPMTPEVIVRELRQVAIGDIVLATLKGQESALRRVARPTPEQSRILKALNVTLPERLSPDRLL